MNQEFANNILATMKSISKIQMDDGKLTVWFENPNDPWSAEEFRSGTFTKDLFNLIELHMNYANAYDTEVSTDKK